MKYLFLFIFASSIISFSTMEQKPWLAKPNQVKGVYIYTDSEPIGEYKYLGSVKLNVTWSGKYDEVKSRLLKKAKKEYPQAEGIIIRFEKGFADGEADAIQF